MKNSVNLVILPTYKCSQNCPYCLFGHLKDSSKTLDLVWLEENLSKIFFKFSVIETSVEGGEISELSDFYFDVFFKLLKLYTKKLNVCTNFVNFHKSLIDNADIIEVGYNFNQYSSDSKRVKDNIKAATSSGKVVIVKSLDISVNDNRLEILAELNKLGIKAWEIIPYQKTKYTQLDFPGYGFFEKIVKDYLKLSSCMEFSFLNKLKIEGIIKPETFPLKTVYITPNCKFGLGKFDSENNFYIEEYETIEDLEKNLEIQQNEQILLCDKCKYKARCLANRYFNPNTVTKIECSGYKGLLKK